jgi:hypothetical protein
MKILLKYILYHCIMFVIPNLLSVKLTEHEKLRCPECTAWWSRRYDLLENDLWQTWHGKPLLIGRGGRKSEFLSTSVSTCTSALPSPPPSTFTSHGRSVHTGTS